MSLTFHPVPSLSNEDRSNNELFPSPSFPSMPITSWKRERERFGSGTRGEVASTSDAAEISCEMFWEAKGRGERRTANGALNKNIHWTERGSVGARLTVLWSLIVSETRRYRSARVEGINLILIVSGPSSFLPARSKSYGRSREIPLRAFSPSRFQPRFG